MGKAYCLRCNKSRPIGDPCDCPPRNAPPDQIAQGKNELVIAARDFLKAFNTLQPTTQRSLWFDTHMGRVRDALAKIPEA